jgi:hypothetical protein
MSAIGIPYTSWSNLPLLIKAMIRKSHLPVATHVLYVIFKKNSLVSDLFPCIWIPTYIMVKYLTPQVKTRVYSSTLDKAQMKKAQF